MKPFTAITNKYNKQAQKVGVTFSQDAVALGANNKEEREANHVGSEGELRALGARRHIRMKRKY